MDFRILGPLTVLDEGREVRLGGSKQRALLAILLLHGNETLSTERIIDELWGDEPPSTASKTVQVHVSRLRKTLSEATGNGAGEIVVTRDHGYEVRLDPEQLDAHRFERMVADGRAELAAGRPDRAAEILEQALALWHGEPLADLAHESFAGREIARLEDLRVAALEELVEAKLALGRHDEVIGRLEALIAQHPYRERLRGQLMLALYRGDRQAEALQAYQETRRALVGELGIEPGERLRDLEHAILTQDPALDLRAADAGELPPELDLATPLAGRDAELAMLREQWAAARHAAGRLVLVTGERGFGKTRLAAALAAEVHADEHPVLYAACGGDPRLALATLARARSLTAPSLVVLDDLDRAGEAVARGAAELAAGAASRAQLVLVTATEPDASPDPAFVLRLGPLDAAAVRDVAALYAGARGDLMAPLERLESASGGNPAEIHRLAGTWARREAARRLDAAADRAAEERSGLRRAEDQLAGSVEELESVRDAIEAGTAVVTCPFKGLASFDVEDADVFFGRERLVAEMVARLAGAPLMGIVGPSGSGKSSALRAGLLAGLRRGVLPGSADWPLALLRPGEHPVRALEDALETADGGTRIVVAVDQFEEVFTLCRDEAERGAFVDALAAHASSERRRATVLIAVRADFYGRCAAYPELSRLLGANHVLVGPMSRDELRRAIELPARRAALRAEPELVEALVTDVEGEPGALPLLSTALLELWRARDGRVLRLSAYEQAGGVRGAVGRMAEAAYERLDPPRRLVARRILLRLAGEGEGATVVRRRVARDELEAGRDPATDDVVALLARERLLTIGEGEVEVAHEALLREWPRLRGWLEEDAEGRRLHRHVTEAANEWEADGRDPAGLYRGARLTAALDWAAGHEEDLNALEREFLDASRGASEVEAERERRRNRRLRVLLAGAGALLTVAVVAGFVAISQRGEARDAALIADAQRLGAEGLTRARLDQAILLARAGNGLDDSAATQSNLLATLLRTPQAIGVIPGLGGWELYTTAASPDGKLFATGGERGVVTMYDTRTHRPVRRYTLKEGLIQSLAFSPDSRTLFVGGQEPIDQPPGALVDLVDVRTAQRKTRTIMPEMKGAFLGGVLPAFLPNGRDVFIQQLDIGESVPPRYWRLDGRTGELRRPALEPGLNTAMYPSTSADRRRVVLSTPDETVLIDPVRMRVARRYDTGSRESALSPDGRLAALGGEDGTVRMLDLRTERVSPPFEGKQEGAIIEMRFAPDGRTVLTVSEDRTVGVWDVESSALRETLVGHQSDVNSLAISPDSRTAYTSGADGRTIVWDIAGDRRLAQPFEVAPFVVENDEFPIALATSPDGRTLAVAQDDGDVSLVDTRTLRERDTIDVMDQFVAAVDFSPDGRLLAVTGGGGKVSLWDARTLRPAEPATLDGFTTTSQELEFSPDGRLLAGAQLGTFQPGRPGADASVVVWDVRTGKPTGGGFDNLVSASLAFSPDGRLIAAADIIEGQAGTEVRDARTGKRITKLPTEDLIRSVAFTPDGRLLATGQYDGKVILWSTDSWKPVGELLEGHEGRVINVDFSPDGRTLATSSEDGTVRLWDVASRKPVGSPITLTAGTFVNAVYAPDGRYLYAASDLSGRAVKWDVSPESWRRHACNVAKRDLTEAEWADALPDRSYRTFCG